MFVTSSILNTVAISYGATAAIPFGTLLAILLIYAFLVIPLLAFGGVIGYCIRSEFQAPCAIKQYPREIPQLAWYWRTPCQMFIGGLLPFSAIAVQLHHLYASMWGFKIYTLPGILFVTFIILIIMTAILTVGLTYIQLSVEDHEWWWRYILFLMHSRIRIEHLVVYICMNPCFFNSDVLNFLFFACHVLNRMEMLNQALFFLLAFPVRLH